MRQPVQIVFVLDVAVGAWLAARGRVEVPRAGVVSVVRA